MTTIRKRRRLESRAGGEAVSTRRIISPHATIATW